MGKLTGQFIQELEQRLQERKETLLSGSYTASLFQGGPDRILRKVGEESGEVIIAAKNNDPQELSQEIADLLFHLLVRLRSQNMNFEDILAVLKDRFKA